jgi:hypothetical protein
LISIQSENENLRACVAQLSTAEAAELTIKFDAALRQVTSFVAEPALTKLLQHTVGVVTRLRTKKDAADCRLNGNGISFRSRFADRGALLLDALGYRQGNGGYWTIDGKVLAATKKAGFIKSVAKKLETELTRRLPALAKSLGLEFLNLIPVRGERVLVQWNRFDDDFACGVLQALLLRCDNTESPAECLERLAGAMQLTNLQVQSSTGSHTLLAGCSRMDLKNKLQLVQINNLTVSALPVPPPF